MENSYTFEASLSLYLLMIPKEREKKSSPNKGGWIAISSEQEIRQKGR